MSHQNEVFADAIQNADSGLLSIAIPPGALDRMKLPRTLIHPRIPFFGNRRRAGPHQPKIRGAVRVQPSIVQQLQLHLVRPVAAGKLATST